MALAEMQRPTIVTNGTGEAVYSPATQGGDGPSITPEEVKEDLARMQLAIQNLGNQVVQRPRQPEQYGQTEPDIRLI